MQISERAGGREKGQGNSKMWSGVDGVGLPSFGWTFQGGK